MSNCAYGFTVGDDGRLPQWWVTDGIGKQQHLGGSDEFQLEWFPVQIIRDHLDFKARRLPSSRV